MQIERDISYGAGADQKLDVYRLPDDGQKALLPVMWGDKDTSVGRANLDRLAAAIHKKGGCIETKIYPGIDHVWLIGTLSWVGDAKDTVLADMTSFFKRAGCKAGS